MNFNDFEEQMQRPRQASEYLQWVDACIQKIHDCKESESFLMPSSRLYKKLLEEARPLALFAKFYFKNNDAVYIKHCINHHYRQIQTDSYDAEVLDSHGNFAFPIHFLEVAFPHIGTSDEDSTSLQFQENNIPLIIDTIKKKNENPSYLLKTALIVYFEDRLEDLVAFKRKMHYALDTKIDTFCLVAFVGMSGNTYFELRS